MMNQIIHTDLKILPQTRNKKINVMKSTILTLSSSRLIQIRSFSVRQDNIFWSDEKTRFKLTLKYSYVSDAKAVIFFSECFCLVSRQNSYLE
jgi:hypothetical protein